MRIIHTSDWHLGRIFYQVHLTDDQAYLLDQFIDLVGDSHPDAVLIAGDIYDRAVPPPGAVELLDDVLSRLVLDFKVPVFIIAGNHDSPQRLGFGSRLLSAQGLHVVGSFTADPYHYVIEDKHGLVHFYAVPYAEPAVVRGDLEDETVRDHEAAMQAIVGRIKRIHPAGERSVLIGHTFVVGGEVSESERPLSVGGAGTVDAACFDGFSYVALGHLHRPQAAGGDHIRYAGSLLKYSFSEAGHDKSVSLVEIGEAGECAVEHISLAPQREVRRVEGAMKDILAGPSPGENPDDYVEVSLLDREPVLDAMGKIRTVYPNALNLQRPKLEIEGEMQELGIDHRKLSDIELFSAFFSQVTGDDLTGEQSAAFSGIVDGLRRREREAGE